MLLEMLMLHAVGFLLTVLAKLLEHRIYCSDTAKDSMAQQCNPMGT